jgi:hypothetical protein
MDRHFGAGLGELAVDPADVAFHRGTQIAVLPHIVAAGHGDLQECQPAAQVRAPPTWTLGPPGGSASLLTCSKRPAPGRAGAWAGGPGGRGHTDFGGCSASSR